MEKSFQAFKTTPPKRVRSNDENGNLMLSAVLRKPLEQITSAVEISANLVLLSKLSPAARSNGSPLHGV
jgi:hypothetical protein